jgi:CRISPR-associated protein (TIGR03986 family)
MAELITGKLLFNQEKRKWQVEFFNEKKQQQSRMFCEAGELSDDIPKNEAEQFDVQFERKPPHGEPIQIRLSGTEFVSTTIRRPTPHAPLAQRQGNAPLQREARDVQRSRQERTNDDMPREFHNPYNFVPALPRPNETLGELGDREPSGHDRFHAELLSGKLRVRMTVETPLLLPDTARVEVTDGHKTFPVRVGKDGKPEINPTAIKGMLRSAYEAITNSRLSVFQSHDERLAFRGDVSEGLFVIPARIENNKIILYTGTSEIEERDGGPKIVQRADKFRRIPEIRQSQYAAWLEMYEPDAFVNVNSKNVFKLSNHSITPNDDKGKLPVHPRKAWAWVEEYKDRRGRFTYWRVMELAYDKKLLGAIPASSPDAISSSPQKVEGYICNTGKTMKGKHDERFFFGENTKFDIDLEKHHIESWDRLIKNYRQEHEKNFDSPPKEGQGRNEYSLEWSRHIQKTEMSETSKSAGLIFEKLKDGTLCYARVEWNRSKNNFDVAELYPVMISRHLNPISPEELLVLELRPARFITQLSPADRVFGWVRQSRPNKDAETKQEKAMPEHLKKLGAYRGQIRIGAIDCVSDKAEAIEPFTSSIPLQILGQPKPQQGRFYVAKDENGNAQPKLKDDEKGLTNEQAGYKKGKGLRGRKVYPHHKALPDNYWVNESDLKNEGVNDLSQIVLKEKFFREYLRPQSKKRRDTQNRSVKGWIKPSTVFKFDIHFINLSKVELGALIWLLSLEDGFHRLGGGKPLGFGSVKLEICRDEGKEAIVSDIRSGKELNESRYSSLADDASKCVGLETIVEEFQKVALMAYKPDMQVIDEQINEQFGRISFIEAFMRMAKGFEDNLPIHYPRTREERTTGHPAPNPEGESFKWFVDNSKTRKNPRTDEAEVVNGFALPNLTEDEGLPILSHRPRGRR